MIICCGEALIDFLPATTNDGQAAFQPFTGGSIYNVAIALARLGTKAGYFGGISEDFFGQLLMDGLLESEVDPSFTLRSERPSTLAFVQFKDGQPQYAFLDENSAGRTITPKNLPSIPNQINALHFGSMSLINEPLGTTLETLAVREKHSTIISLDPNIRPTLVGDRDAYLQRLARMIALANIIKISDEDLAWIYPGVDPQTVVKQWLLDGADLVILTKGADGATGFSNAGEIIQPVRKVTVADTVGAGDTFTAGLLHALNAQGLLNKTALPKISKMHLQAAMALATKAASITVSRPGANPPWHHEM